MKFQVELSLQIDMSPEHLTQRFGTTDPDQALVKMRAEGDAAVAQWMEEAKEGEAEVIAASCRVTGLHG